MQMKTWMFTAVIVCLTLGLLAAGVPVQPLIIANVAERCDRAKTGASQGRASDSLLQTMPPAGVAAGGAVNTERGGFEPPLRI